MWDSEILSGQESLTEKVKFNCDLKGSNRVRLDI